MKTLGIVILAAMGINMISGNIYAEEISQNQIVLKFASAGEFYKQGHYDLAIETYEEIIKAGKESGPLYYNLGNSYLKNNNLAKVILNYERALRLTPRDSDLHFNLNFARSLMKKYQREQNQHFLSQGMKSFSRFYSLDELVMIISFLGFLMGGVYLISLYGKWPPQRRKYTFIPLGLIIVMCVIAVFVKMRENSNAAIIMTATQALFEPRDDATAHYPLSEGAKVKITKEGEQWLKIKRQDGKSGWIPKEACVKI